MNGTKLQGAQDPDEFLYRMETARNRLHVLQEDHTSPIVQSTSPELAEILSRLRQLTNIDQQGGQLLRDEQQSQSGRQPLREQQPPPPSSADDTCPPPEAGGAEGTPAAGTGGATPKEKSEAGGTLEVTPAVTRRAAAAAGGLNSLVAECTLRELQQLNLYAGADLPDMAHRQELLTFAEDACVTTNTQLQMRSEGEKKAKIVPNTFSEARKLPEAALWEAAEDKEIASLIKHQVYDLVTSVPAGSKTIGSRWVYKVKADDSHKARVVVLGWGMVAGVHCGSTFAPVSRLQSIRMVLALAAEKTSRCCSTMSQRHFSTLPSMKRSS